MRLPGWVQGLLVIVAMVAGVVIAYAFNIFVGIAISILAAAIGISRWIQHREPPGPAER